MQVYFTRYASRCAEHLNKEQYQLTCGDYIRMHNGGPDGCARESTEEAKNKVNYCMSN